MKNVTITLKDESLSSEDINSYASKLKKEGLYFTSVQPYGVITGSAAESLVNKLKQNKELHVNDNSPSYHIAPPGSDVQ